MKCGAPQGWGPTTCPLVGQGRGLQGPGHGPSRETPVRGTNEVIANQGSGLKTRRENLFSGDKPQEAVEIVAVELAPKVLTETLARHSASEVRRGGVLSCRVFSASPCVRQSRNKTDTTESATSSSSRKSSSLASVRSVWRFRWVDSTSEEQWYLWVALVIVLGTSEISVVVPVTKSHARGPWWGNECVPPLGILSDRRCETHSRHQWRRLLDLGSVCKMASQPEGGSHAHLRRIEHAPDRVADEFDGSLLGEASRSVLKQKVSRCVVQKEVSSRLFDLRQAALRPQRAHTVTEHNQLLLAGDVQLSSIRHHLDCEQHLAEVVRDRGLGRGESKHYRDVYERPEMPARLPTTEVQTLSHQLKAPQENSGNLQKQLPSAFQINLSGTSRLADARDSAHRDSQMLRQKMRRCEKDKRSTQRRRSGINLTKYATLPNSASGFCF